MEQEWEFLLDFKDLFIEYQIPNYAFIKRNIMESIADNRGMKIRDKDGTRISDTNYFYFNQGFSYNEITLNAIHGFFDYIDSKHEFTFNWDGACWHQIYEKGDYHDWHTHPTKNMSAVFYVQCGSNQGTVFKIGNQEYRTPSSEGTIITFPSGLVHKTLPHDGEERRVIISFNWDNNGPKYEREI